MASALVIFVGGAIGLVIIYFILVVRDKMKLRKLKKNYDEKKDLSKEGEEINKELRAGIRDAGNGREASDTGAAESSAARISESLREELLQKKSSVSSGKNSKSSRGFFARRRQRRG